MYKWSRYPIGLGVALFFFGIGFQFTEYNGYGLIVGGVLCIGGGIVLDLLLGEKEEK